MQFLKSYHVHKVIWLRPRLTVQKGYTEVNIKLGHYFDVVNLVPYKVINDAGKFTWVTTFRRSCHLPPFDDDLVWKVRKVNIELVRDFDVENIPIKLQNWHWNDHIFVFFSKLTCCIYSPTFLHCFHVCGVNLENDMWGQNRHFLYPHLVFILNCLTFTLNTSWEYTKTTKMFQYQGHMFKVKIITAKYYTNIDLWCG